MPTGWRIVKSRYRHHAFDGEGARLYGGRWNAPGVAVVYTAESIALAVLEILVHLESEAQLRGYELGSVSFEEALVDSLDLERLPSRWRRSPGSPALQQIGTEWIAGGSSAILEVPSVITGERERNYLLNPSHPDFLQVGLSAPEPFWIDPRLG